MPPKSDCFIRMIIAGHRISGQEPSRNSFVIYDKKKFKAVPVAKRWSLYLSSLPLEYVNPSTGELVGMR